MQSANGFISFSSAPSQGHNYWSEHEEYLILKGLNYVFNNPMVKKIAQNFPFDSTILAKPPSRWR